MSRETLPLIALDLALRSTGIAWSSPHLGVRTVAPTCRGHERLDEIVRAVSTVVAGCRPRLAVIERLPVIAGRGDSAVVMAGPHWLVRHWLWLHRIPYTLVTPATLKTYATGKGGGPDADKRAVTIAAQQMLHPHGVYVRNDDEADAVVLLALALHHYGRPLVPSTRRYHAEAMGTVEWPDLTPAEQPLAGGGTAPSEGPTP